ncbi:response regulator [Flavitalea sp. BT771]|uniref:response regulator n=1 Tax=Flavitalea sp. BT771 TaxID=3063329 RepID=UPI0026E28E0E|nr:response regulator [Flavitalea sp. BT771]MDO6435042.1 response regulator [Flavitalea sp. BT771]MDV6223942.1 response regulator [Flavitalea sp. BT771]
MKKQILAIDDSKAIRFLLQTVLGKEYSVITVPDGFSAMYYLSHRQMPDLIIADPQLPDMENWELIQQLSSSGMYGDIPLIVLSGLEKKETELKCLEYGIVKHFVKPFNPVDLMSAISDLVKSRQLDKDLSAMAS